MVFLYFIIYYIMETSIYLAKIIWPLFIVIALSMIMSHNHYKEMIKKMWDNLLLMYISGLFAYTIGILIVLNHNIWVLDWFVIITILWWLSLIKWVSLILFPNFTMGFANNLKLTKWLMNFIWILWLVLGFILTYLWFWNM